MCGYEVFRIAEYQTHTKIMANGVGVTEGGACMAVFETENAPGFEVLEDGGGISLSNRGGYIEIDRDQLLALLALTRHWADTGEPIQ